MTGMGGDVYESLPDCPKDVLSAGVALEEEYEEYHEDDHDGDNAPESPYISGEREIDIHAEETRDHGQGKHDGAEVGEHLHDLVGLVGLQGVESLTETFDQFTVVFHHIEHLLVLVEDIAPVVVHLEYTAVGGVVVGDTFVVYEEFLAFYEAFNATALKHVEHAKLGFEGGVELDDVATVDGDVLDDALGLLVEDVEIDHIEVGAYGQDKLVGFLHQAVEDVVEKEVATGHVLEGVFVVLGKVFLRLVEEFVDYPMGFTDSDDIVPSPEELYFGDTHKTFLLVEIGEVQDKEEIIVVLVYLGTVVCFVAVLDVEGVEMVSINKEVVVVFRRIGDMLPLKAAVLNGFNHCRGPFLFSRSLRGQYFTFEYYLISASAKVLRKIELTKYLFDREIDIYP